MAMVRLIAWTASITKKERRRKTMMEESCLLARAFVGLFASYHF
jgi:hypothetical protein